MYNVWILQVSLVFGDAFKIIQSSAFIRQSQSQDSLVTRNSLVLCDILYFITSMFALCFARKALWALLFQINQCIDANDKYIYTWISPSPDKMPALSQPWVQLSALCGLLYVSILSRECEISIGIHLIFHVFI